MPSLAATLSDLLPRDADLRRSILFFGIVGLVLTAGLATLLSIWHVLVIVLSGFFLLLTIKRPRWILTFLAVWVPLEPFLLKFVPDEIYIYARYFSEGLIYMLALTVVLRASLGEKRLKQSPLDLPFVLFLLVLIAGAVMNAVPTHIAFLGIRQIIRFVLLFFIVVFLYPPREYIRRLTVLMFGVVLLEAGLGIAQGFIGAPADEFLIPSERKFYESIQLTSGTTQFWDPGSRVFATMGRYDQLGTFLAFFLLLAIGFLYERDSREDRNRLGLILAVGIPALLLTYSRSSWFGFLIGFLLIGMWFMRDRRVLVGFLLFCGMVAGYLGYSGIIVPALTEETGRQTVAERFFEAFSYERWRGEFFGLGRLYWMVQTPRIVVRASPLFGLGPGQFGGGAAAALGNTRAYDALGLPFGVYGTEGYIDNNWFSLLGETGFLGLAFYLWMYGALYLAARRVFHWSTDPLTRGLALGFMGALVAVALNAFLATFLEVRTLALYLWLYGAFIVVLGRREKII
ncbi:O-antigen ligase family protein [Candidatus Uhrbacteria bacterium]|nr:O-antigen ligase family protein [Candidatus Uhrbacteria bacterium]